jgi:hypothetical protein
VKRKVGDWFCFTNWNSPLPAPPHKNGLKINYIDTVPFWHSAENFRI